MDNFPEALPADADPASARYFPPAGGRYEVKPGFFRLGQDLGNGPADARVFQFDSGFPSFRQNKLQARAERLDKYYQTCNYPPATASAVARFTAHRLAQEHPELFRLEEGEGKTHLHCALTGETLAFDPEFQLVGHHRDFAHPTARRGNSPGGVFQGHLLCGDPRPPYASALDALACQAHEDLAVVCRAPERRSEKSLCRRARAKASGARRPKEAYLTEDDLPTEGNAAPGACSRAQPGWIFQTASERRDWLAAAHVCSPSHWAAEEKVGRDFAAVHAPVAGMEPLNRRSPDLVRALIERGPYVRFAWSLSTDTRLNHHPAPPPGTPPESGQGFLFDPARPRLFVRLERQVLWGFPQENAALFTIRLYFRDCAALTPQERAQLRAAIASMTPESLRYKGLASHRDAILEWLGQGLAIARRGNSPSGAGRES